MIEAKADGEAAFKEMEVAKEADGISPVASSTELPSHAQKRSLARGLQLTCRR